MTENEIKEMLKDIIDNGAEYESRDICGECRYKRENCDDTCTLTSRLWNKYHLGDEIRSDYEYRKVEKWYVFDYGDNDYRTFKDDTNCAVPCVFEGPKEKCEKWIKEHTKTWLDEYYPIVNPSPNSDICLNEHKRDAIEEVCQKILEETKKMWQEDSDYFTDLEDFIKVLGVEV